MRFPSPDEIARYRRKAASLAEAWASVLGTPPSTRALARVLAIAEHESRLGDASRDHNWGAVHKRALSAVERLTLHAHGLFATGRDVALRAARTLLPAGADEALSIDTSPTSGPYFVWMWAFPNDTEAAKRFLHELLVRRPAVRAALEEPTPEPVARAMYESKYYEGFHPGDPEANIRDYSRRIAELELPIVAALTQGAPPSMAASFAPAPARAAAFRASIAPTAPSRSIELALGAVVVLVTASALGRARR